jgi:hypothetical protein
MSNQGLKILTPLPSERPGRGEEPSVECVLLNVSRLCSTADWKAFSIVMVHGLNGDSIETWTQGGCCWPRDLLPTKLTTARVLTFGYNADLAWNDSTFGIADHANMLLTSLRDKREAPHVSGICKRGGL